MAYKRKIKYQLEPCTNSYFGRFSYIDLSSKIFGAFEVKIGGKEHIMVIPTALPEMTGWIALADGCKTLTSRGATPRAALENLRTRIKGSFGIRAKNYARYIDLVGFDSEPNHFFEKVISARQKIKLRFQSNNPNAAKLEKEVLSLISAILFRYSNITFDSIGDICSKIQLVFSGADYQVQILYDSPHYVDISCRKATNGLANPEAFSVVQETREININGDSVNSLFAPLDSFFKALQDERMLADSVCCQTIQQDSCEISLL